MKIIDEKIQNNNPSLIKGGYYNMNVNIDYVKLKEKLLKVFKDLKQLQKV
jgi:hypothetical protein